MRRRFQTGHIFARGKRRKVWVGRYLEPILDNGKVKTVLRSRVLGPCAELSKSAARTILEDLLRPLNEGHHTPTETASFQEFYAKWESDLLPTYRESTRNFYRDTAKRWILPSFKGWRMAEIQPAAIQQFINLFAGKCSRSVLKHVRATLNCLFRTAVDWRYLKENPAANLKLPLGKAVVRAQVLKPAEIARLIEYLASPYREMVMFAAVTGVRETELCGLQWADLDGEQQVVHIRRRVYRRKVGETKTEQSVRTIPVSAEVLAALAQHRGQPGEFVFHGARGGYLRADEVLHRHILPVAQSLGLPPFTWRSFRRSAESAMHNGGVPLKAQQAMLGHTNVNTTMLYAETNEESKRAAAETLGNLIFPKFSQNATPVATDRPN